MKIGIVGGGLMGLSLAYRLSGKGHAVTVFERENQLGGLATYHDYGLFFWDRFYHVINPTDSYLIRLIKDIGLEDGLHWARTLTGFYVDRQFYSISSGLEFLRFPLVSLLGKVRLALMILYCSRITDWKRLEEKTVEDWLVRTCGRDTYEKMWLPLLLAKFGENYRRVSAVFIWSYIKRIFASRDSSAHKERLGYVSGGYKTVIDRLEELIDTSGGEIRRKVLVKQIYADSERGLWIEYDQEREHFDKIIFTGPASFLQNVAAALTTQTRTGGSVEYLGVICMVLVTRKPLVPFYVVNVADQRVFFTGVIGMSNLVSLKETAGYHLTFLPKYVLSNDPLLRQSDEKLTERFLDGLRLMFPELEAEDIQGMHINRAIKVQPLQVLNYSRLVPQVTTSHGDFFVLNTSQFVNCTLNNNEVIRAVDEFIQEFGPRLDEISPVEPAKAAVAV